MPNDLELIKFVPCLPDMDYWFCEGVLFVKKALPAERITEIIAEHLK